MMIRFVTSLALAIIILASLALPASAQDNAVDLELDDEGATGWDIGNIKPGDSDTKTVTLHNVGERDGFVIIWVSDIVSSEGENPESETGDTGEPGELDQYLLFNLSCDGLSTSLKLPTTIDNFPHSASESDIKISPLNVGKRVTLVWEWEFSETGEAQNDAQGDSLSFTINYMLKEFPASTSGWWIPGPPSRLGTTDVRGKVSTACVFLSSVTAISEDGLCTLTIPKGTVGLTTELECLTEISMLTIEPPPPPEEAHIVGLACDFQPSGTTFEPPITLECNYDPTDIPEGIAEEDLVIAYYDEGAGEWVDLECRVNPEANAITTSISHFTAFAILAYELVPEAAFIPAAAAFTFSGLQISPAEVEIGGTITISALVENTGDKLGVLTATLNVNGTAEEVKYVALEPGARTRVSFTTSRDVAGSYSVDVNGLSGSFTVRQQPSVAPPAELPPVPAKVPIWPLIGGIIAGVIIGGLGVFFWMRSRAH